MPILSAPEIKRQILLSSDQSGIRKRMESNLESITEGDIIEIGNELERIVNSKGWAHVEAFMFRHMNVMGLIFNKEDDSTQKGIAQGYVNLIQYINLMIKRKNELTKKQDSGTTDDSKEKKK